MLNNRNETLKNQLVTAGFLPIIFCGDIYIYIYSVFAIFFLSLELNKNINKIKLIIYYIGLLSFIINQDILILLSIVIIFIYDELLVVKYNNFVKYIYYLICFFISIAFISNYGNTERIEFLNNNVFNSVLYIYISIFALSIRQSYISLPFVLMFITRTAVFAWIIWFLSRFLKEKDHLKINVIALFFGISLFFTLGFLKKIDIESLPYVVGFERIFIIQDNSLGSRINQYNTFVGNLDLLQILTNSNEALLITSNLIMVPHSTIATLLAKGGIFYLIFIYMIAAYRVRSSIFLPIFFASIFLHSSFIPHILILIEKFKESEDMQ